VWVIWREGFGEERGRDTERTWGKGTSNERSSRGLTKNQKACRKEERIGPTDDRNTSEETCVKTAKPVAREVDCAGGKPDRKKKTTWVTGGKPYSGESPNHGLTGEWKKKNPCQGSPCAGPFIDEPGTIKAGGGVGGTRKVVRGGKHSRKNIETRKMF